MIDILYLAYNRLEFTRESLKQLVRNTNWSQVRWLVKMVDVDEYGNDDGTQDLVNEFGRGLAREVTLVSNGQRGPVKAMNQFLSLKLADVFVKLDSDVIVPPGWLAPGIQVMAQHPGLSFLGLEPPASRTKAPWASKPIPAPENTLPAPPWPGYAPCDAIGGVGFMRTEAFNGRPPMVQHSTYGGFTDWQHQQADLMKGWIVPPLKLFLLDRLDFEPWASLSRQYINKGWQRPWTKYPAAAAGDLWKWWLSAEKGSL